MKVCRETTVAGKTIIRKYKALCKREKGRKRASKKHTTKEAVKKINAINATTNLTIKLNHNFKKGDWHITLTYKGEEPDNKEARKDKEKFLRNLKAYCNKNNITLKRIDVTEYLNKRIHHHIICSKIDPEVVERLWTKGFVNFKALDESGNYEKLAAYLVKETSKTYNMDNSVNKRRFNCSRTIVTPESKNEEVPESEIEKMKCAKGYYIDQDSIKEYEHPVLKIDCKQYIMVSLREEPRIKKWNKGKVIMEQNYNRYINYAEEQATLLESKRGNRHD